MADETKTAPEPTTPQPDAPEQPTTSASADTTKPEAGKTFTEAEVNAMMADRIAKNEKAIRKQLEDEHKKSLERANMDEVERIKAELEDERKAKADLEARATRAERKASLVGKVADAEAALKLVDPDQHLNEDGAVDHEALLETYPFLKPQTNAGPAPIGGANPKGKKDPSNMSDTEFYTSRTSKN